MTSDRLALVTGATGYVGNHVTEELLREGWSVRTLSRSRDKALTMSWGERIVDEGMQAGPGEVEVFEGDASNFADLNAALKGATAAWYLIHSMGDEQDFRQAEMDMAEQFATAAEAQKVGRIVFLGGLHPEGEELSEHLASRVDVGQVFLDSDVPAAVLQAGVVLGAGSASFQMLRHLSERLPGAVGPDWIGHEITPISVRDVVYYLVKAAELPPEVNRTFDVGGPDTLRYFDMMKQYADVVGLTPRMVFTAPVTTPNLAAHWISLVTPIKTDLATPLISSLLHDTVVKERDLEQMVGTPAGGNQSFRRAIEFATEHVNTCRWVKTLAGVGTAVGICAGVGSILTDPNNRFYKRLDLPAWQPPAALFPIAWTALYADIAVMNALVLADAAEADDKKGWRMQVAALGTNLVLNAGWTGVFFRSKRKKLAAAWAGGLAVSSADLVRRAWASAPQRGAVLASYAAWTAFAFALSSEIARRN